MDEVPGKDGKPMKVPENVESMKNVYNNNKISTKPGVTLQFAIAA